jgi:hypothetical protein
MKARKRDRSTADYSTHTVRLPATLPSWAASPDRVVMFTRPRCPACRSLDLQTQRSTTANGVTFRHTKCRICSHRFITIAQ